MKKRHYKQIIQRFLFVFSNVVIWIAAGSIAVTNAQQTRPAGIDPNERIKISADTLTVNNENRYAEFSGQVKAEQGDTSIRADTIRIFYKSRLTENKEKEPTPVSNCGILRGYNRFRFFREIILLRSRIQRSPSRIHLSSSNSCSFLGFP